MNNLENSVAQESSCFLILIPDARKSCLDSTCRRQCTCKLPVTVATVTELGDQLAVELEDEDTAGLVVHHDDVTISVH